MSDYLGISAVSTAWASVSITGVTIKAASTIPEAVAARDCPLLAPAPTFVSGITIEPVSFGAPADMRATCRYTLTYRLYYSAVGSTRGLVDVYSGLMDKVGAILSAAFDNSNLTSTVEFWPSGATAPAVVTDPAGNQFIGSDLTFDVITFVR